MYQELSEMPSCIKSFSSLSSEKGTCAAPFKDGETEAQQSYIAGLVHTAGNSQARAPIQTGLGRKVSGKEEGGTSKCQSREAAALSLEIRGPRTGPDSHCRSVHCLV